jgi:hypothetical protein
MFQLEFFVVAVKPIALDQVLDFHGFSEECPEGLDLPGGPVS